MYGTEWDDEADEQTTSSWTKLRSQLPELETIRIPRWLDTISTTRWYLHGFADASQRAYAAVVYVVASTEGQPPKATLIAAKTKVAPIKTLSIPRLELSAAHLLAKLIVNVKGYLRSQPVKIFCWSDSEVTLAWLTSHPNNWKVFVANRVSDIATSLPGAVWSHVRSCDNPADLASRGTSPSQLSAEQIWWQGPDWLTTKWEDWTNTAEPPRLTHLEERPRAAVFVSNLQTKERPTEDLISRFSSLSKLLRVTAYILRWRNQSRQPRLARIKGDLSAPELQAARSALIRAVQAEHFPEETSSLATKHDLSHRSPLRRFLSFLDNYQIIRIGGRLQNSFLSDEEKHPYVLPSASHLSELLIRDAHQRTLHGGPQLIQSYLLRTVWIIHARNRIRNLTAKCIRCIRFRGQTQQQQMAPLPATRVTPTRPFTVSGVDYAGPFLLRTAKGRGHKAYKGYPAIFICTVTRAVHLEIVSDYTSQGFLLAFRRFVSRRGLCRTLLSDNGTTFQGADSDLRRLLSASSEVSNEITRSLANDGVEWRFIPPQAPHFGGLWEAGVKAFKHHLRRTLREAKLTHEEFSTLAAQIEACLNSRPISPLSSDPRDVTALTPGHFLVGSTLTAIPEPTNFDSSISTVSRYKLTTLMRDHFWRRWSQECLRNLQSRSKWLEPNRTIHEGDLVLITDELTPPTRWPLARVVQCHPGRDGLTRVLTLKTASTTLQRPIVKVVHLPIEQGFNTSSEFSDNNSSPVKDVQPSSSRWAVRQLNPKIKTPRN